MSPIPLQGQPYLSDARPGGFLVFPYEGTSLRSSLANALFYLGEEAMAEAVYTTFSRNPLAQKNAPLCTWGRAVRQLTAEKYGGRVFLPLTEEHDAQLREAYPTTAGEFLDIAAQERKKGLLVDSSGFAAQGGYSCRLPAIHTLLDGGTVLQLGTNLENGQPGAEHLFVSGKQVYLSRTRRLGVIGSLEVTASQDKFGDNLSRFLM